MAEETDLENRRIWHSASKPLISRSRDSHVLRDTRDLPYEGDSLSVALSYDTISLTLRLLVDE